jgi:hypothetical protein
MNISDIIKEHKIHEKLNYWLRYSLTFRTSGMVWKKLARTGLPVLLALLVIAGVYFHARLSDTQTPSVQNGILDLTKWNGGKTIEIAGEWEFYWDSLLTDEDIKKGNQDPILADAPNKWNYYKIDNVGLPGKGKATYHVHVTGAKAGVQYGVRIQNISTVYRLYMDGVLVVQNGNFWDTESSPASAYRPQLAAFTPKLNDFDLVLQVSNNAFAMGGMWEPIIFGTYEKIFQFDKQISIAGASTIAGLIITCLFFIIFFMAQRRERDMLILTGVGVLILMRFLMIGDAALIVLFPEISIAWAGRIEFLTSP